MYEMMFAVFTLIVLIVCVFTPFLGWVNLSPYMRKRSFSKWVLYTIYWKDGMKGVSAWVGGVTVVASLVIAFFWSATTILSYFLLS